LILAYGFLGNKNANGGMRMGAGQGESHGTGTEMKIFVWRHSKWFSSWSMFDEPQICKHNYMQAEVVILARSREEALQLLEGDDSWNIEELKRLEPKVIPLDRPTLVSKLIASG
jgi:hypothetical protein